MNLDRLNAYSPVVLGLLRIVAALLFIEHGTQKLFDFPASGHGAMALTPLFLTAAIIETAGGILLLLGLFARFAAFIMSGEMAVTYWMMHFPHNFFPVNNFGDAAVLFCFVFLYIVFAGPGAFSLDGIRSKASPDRQLYAEKGAA